MRITSADLQFNSERHFVAGREVRESLNANVAGKHIQMDRYERVEVAASSKLSLRLAADIPSVRQPQLDALQARLRPESSLAASEVEPNSFVLAPDDETLNRLRMLLVALGRQAEDIDQQLNKLAGLGSLPLPSASAANPNTTVASSQAQVSDEFLQYSYSATEWQGEYLNLSASGKITTADGREIAFGMRLEMLNLQYSHQQINMSVGALKDPLVLNLGAGPVRLDAAKPMEFDLDADGRREKMAMLQGQSAYLALDRDGNGKIDNGRELFGALSGDGFADLARFDEDGNGFIDEADTVFEQLKLWRPQADGGEVLVSLKEAGVGAIALGRIDSQFDLISQQQLAGQVRSTGMFFFESGQVGSVQQIDLAV